MWWRLVRAAARTAAGTKDGTSMVLGEVQDHEPTRQQAGRTRRTNLRRFTNPMSDLQDSPATSRG